MEIVIRTLLIYFTVLLSFSQSSLGLPRQFDYPESRVIGGEPAAVGQFPFHVGLRLKVENRSDLVTCGGVLIADDYVLTAGHCVAPKVIEYIEVHLGTIKVVNDDKPHLVFVLQRESFIPHELWRNETRTDDIALLKLPQKVALSDTLNTIDLPTYADASNLDLVGKYLTASGWGRYSDDSQNRSHILQFVRLRVIEEKVCQHFFPEVQIGMICTSTSLGKGVCHSDSGGPLIYRDEAKNRTILIGLTSYGNPYSCVRDGWPAVFARASTFLKWIHEHSGIPIKEK